jgi:hypothetical protein
MVWVYKNVIGALIELYVGNNLSDICVDSQKHELVNKIKGAAS